MDKTSDLPYSKSPFDNDFREESIKYSKYLKNIFTPYFKKIISKSKYVKINNFLYPKPGDHISNIKNLKQKVKYAKEPYFLYFDVKKYYPSVNHQKLKLLIIKHYLISRDCKNLDNKTYEELLKHKKITVYFKRFLKFLDKYLSYSNFDWVWLLASNPTTFVLSEIFLFDFFVWINAHTFRWNDDFIIFNRKKDEINFEFKNFITPNIKNLDLKLNPDKVVLWKLFTDEVSYIWLTFKKLWFVYIQQKRIEEYLEKVKNIFYKKVNEEFKNKIKKLRNLQFWFFYYYRICDIKYIWEKVSAKTRDLVRWYLFLYKPEWKTRFFITNESLWKLNVIDFTTLK